MGVPLKPNRTFLRDSFIQSNCNAIACDISTCSPESFAIEVNDQFIFKFQIFTSPHQDVSLKLYLLTATFVRGPRLIKIDCAISSITRLRHHVNPTRFVSSLQTPTLSRGRT